MLNQFSRSELLIGSDGMELLKNARVAVFGVGGVGGHCIDALARTGIGRLDIFDNDIVSVTNINRQLVATLDTVGEYKVDVMKKHIHAINPDAVVNAHQCFFMPENSHEFDFAEYDYVVDAIDTVTAKIELVVKAKAAGVPVICSMGAGNKLDALSFQVTDIYKTSVCPLARVMRQELRKRNIDGCKVVYSTAPAMTPLASEEVIAKRTVAGSVAFVPSVAGLIIAGEVIKDLIKLLNIPKGR